jgi:secreted Zn-dependent insulinase-like peptidase
LNCFLAYPSVSSEKHIEILDELKSQILKNKNLSGSAKFEYFINNYLSRSYIEWLVQGNVYPEQCLELILDIHRLIQKDGMKLLEMSSIRTVKLPTDFNFYYNFQSKDEFNENSAVISYFQLANLTDKESCMLELIEYAIYEKFFDELRTKQTLGYIANCQYKYYRKVDGLIFKVQSSTQCPEYVLSRITAFLDDYNLADEKNFTDQDFQTHLDSLITKLKVKFLNLAEEVEDNFDEIKIREYVFDRIERQIKILQTNLNKKELVEFYEEHFHLSPKRFDVMLVANNHIKENEKMLEKIRMKEKKENFNEKIDAHENLDLEDNMPRREEVKNDGQLKRMCELYPDFYYFIKK